MMYEAIKNFSKQFEFEPKIENEENLQRREKFLMVGMGGSGLPADLVRAWNPRIDILVHKNYGLPPVCASQTELPERLVIIISYSGNTEEALDAYREAKKKGCSLGAISVGGKLLEYAKKDKIPYIQLPDTGIQPRSALGFSFKALLKMMGVEEEVLKEVSRYALSLDPVAAEEEGKALAYRLKGFVPIIYSSEQNWAIAYNWKVKFNETGKIPAFYNVFPELNHNEMTGFDVSDATRSLSEKFYFLILKDTTDHPQIVKRARALANLYHDRGLHVETIDLGGGKIFLKIFQSLLLADWTAYYLGENYGVETEQVPMVEEFKKLIA
jgi:glucose/mannose-6-phosphate isomerase